LDVVVIDQFATVSGGYSLLDFSHEPLVEVHHAFYRVRYRLVDGPPIDRFAAELVETSGVLLLPGSQFGHPENHFRIGFGRQNLPEALGRLEAFLDSR
jgi:aspartate/methionine/tyrosine aminotransferase